MPRAPRLGGALHLEDIFLKKKEEKVTQKNNNKNKNKTKKKKETCAHAHTHTHTESWTETVGERQ